MYINVYKCLSSNITLILIHRIPDPCQVKPKQDTRASHGWHGLKGILLESMALDSHWYRCSMLLTWLHSTRNILIFGLHAEATAEIFGQLHGVEGFLAFAGVVPSLPCVAAGLWSPSISEGRQLGWIRLPSCMHLRYFFGLFQGPVFMVYLVLTQLASGKVYTNDRCAMTARASGVI